MQRVRSWTMQNEMRGVLGLVFANAAKRIIDFASSREGRVSVTMKHKFLRGNRGNLCFEEFR